MKKTMQITFPGLLHVIVAQSIQLIKNEFHNIMHNPLQKKFIVLLIIVALALIAMQIDISRQIDSSALIRIHVLGNSNSDADQALKLDVKDAVVSYLTPLLEVSQTLDESRTIIQNNIPQIVQIAKDTLSQQGCAHTVTLQYGDFDFPLRHYSGFSLPAGNYEALRILIGEAKGRNWWCVLFPPLCFTDSNVQSTTAETAVAPSCKYTDSLPKQHIIIKWRGKELWETRMDELSNYD